MSLKPGDMNCRIAISYVQSGRGPRRRHRRPRKRAPRQGSA